MDPDPDSGSTTVCVWWRRLLDQAAAPNKGNPTREKEEREICLYLLCFKRGDPPPLFIGAREEPTPLPFPCGTKPHKGGGGAGLEGGEEPPLGARPKGKGLPPTNGPQKAHKPFFFLFNYLNHLFNI